MFVISNHLQKPLKIIFPNNRRLIATISFFILLLLAAADAYSQAEVEPWGNISGIRRHGQLFGFESAIKVVNGKGYVVVTAKDWQHPHFKRDGHSQIITTNIDSLFFKETVEDLSAGKIKVTVNINAHA